MAKAKISLSLYLYLPLWFYLLKERPKFNKEKNSDVILRSDLHVNDHWGGVRWWLSEFFIKKE